jgi:hypothetical protein
MRFFQTVLTVSGEEESFWGDFFTDLYAYAYYPNLNMDTDSMIFIKNLILGIFIGLCIAAFGMVYNKRVLGKFVRALLREECLSKESAKTLSQLGVMQNYAIRNAVRKSVNLRRVVRCREEEEFLAEQEKLRLEFEESAKGDKKASFREEKFEIDTANDHFYIPEEMKYMADVKFESRGTTWLGAILFVIIMAIVFVALIIFLPDIFQMLDSFAGGFSSMGKNNIL